MAADPLIFIGDLLDENFSTQTFYDRNARSPSIYIGRWIDSLSTEFPSLSIFSHQQSHKPLGFEEKHYLNIRQVRVELRTDDVEELHTIEEEIQRVVGENSKNPQTERFPEPGIKHIAMNSSVDVFESITDVIVYRRSLLIDCWSQYAYT